MLGPDLTNVGTKVSRAWIYKWLKDPRTLTDGDGNVTVDGYESEDEPRMPKFRLTEDELRALSAYLSTLASQALPRLQVRSQGSRCVVETARPGRSGRNALPADVLHDVPFPGGHPRRRNQD